MPRTPRHAFWMLLGMWLWLALFGPIGARWAFAADPQLARLEQQLHGAVNEFRGAHKLIALERRADLDAVARAHSEDMLRRGFFAHENPDGELWPQRIERAQIRGYTLAGENVAQTNEADANRAVLEGWRNSPDHRRNLEFRAFNATGIGIARAPDGRLLYTQLYVTFPR
jgi:uncharacterized protein YkwD